MFKKPVRIKSNNQVKGSERKGIKDILSKSFPGIAENDLNVLLNNKKDPLNCIKLVTHSNEIVQVYVLQKQPLFFTVQNNVFPTVFLLWKFSNLISNFTTHPQVVNFISSGADLMLPGVITPPPNSGLLKFNSVQEGTPVYVNTSVNKAAFAVGTAAQSSFDMDHAGGKGKCVIIYHFFGDHLCSIDGNSSGSMPSLGAPEWLLLNNYDSDFPAIEARVSPESKAVETISVKADISINEDVGSNSIEESEETALETHYQENVSNSTEDMDELLNYCFLASIKYSKTLTLPLLISNFFKLQMLPMCPEGTTLDIKKTSYKKLKPYLEEMAKIGLITIKEIKKGVEAVTDINKNHPKFSEFYLKPENRPKKDNVEESQKQTVITESYVVTANVLPFFWPAGYQKGDIVDRPNIRKLVTEYVKSNNSQVIENTKLVKPNTDVLRSICKTDNPVSWEEVFEKVCESMKSCFKVNSGNDQIFNKGKVSPITMSVSVRSGNKKVTLVDNLEIFGVNINEFAKDCQHGVAASTSITPTPPGKRCDQLLVQGNQVVFIHNLLVEKYKIPKKYIRGLELAPKKKK
ncbi:eukaryotic translation initiation factor 2D [Euwallacea similis]|uniref:eukaryotic translation initiation factor 2D n=1 Tax=Euwallacea similis TaxID=1736056 RepID=UPI00344D4EA2